MSVTLYGSDDKDALEGCMALCQKYENLFSRTVESSDIARLNRDGTAVVAPETLDIIGTSLRYGELSGGKFDITIGAVSALWDFHAASPAPPDAATLASALKTVDYRQVTVDRAESRVTLSIPGAAVDLGAIAKGYISDRLRDYLRERGVESAVIDLGGNILTVGKKPDGANWIVGIRSPFDTSKTLGTLSVPEKAGRHLRHLRALL